MLLSLDSSTPAVGFYFRVDFLSAPLPIDAKFKEVSGISSEIETQAVKEGGENLSMHALPTRVTHGNLVLKRGLIHNSLLAAQFNVAMTTMSVLPSPVMVSLLDSKGIPSFSWTFSDAYPVKWSMGDFNADNNEVVIETMELAYSSFKTIRV